MKTSHNVSGVTSIRYLARRLLQVDANLPEDVCNLQLVQ